MSDVLNFCSRLARQMPSTAITGVHHVEIEYRWYQDDSEEGPVIHCRDSHGSDLGNKLNPAQYRQLSTFMIDEVDTLRRSSNAIPRPNLLTIVIGPDGSLTGQLIHSPQIDTDYERRQRKALGDERYEKFESERNNQKKMPPAAQVATSTVDISAPTVPELLGFIRSELLKAVPTNWDVLDVEGEVWTENGQPSVSTIYHYVVKGDRKRFTATNPFGPMNAVIHLHDQFRLEGKPWRKIKLQFRRNSTATSIDTE